MEQWTQWNPIAGLAPKYSLETACDDTENFKMILSEVNNTQNILQITFEHHTDFYRRISTSFAKNFTNELSNRYGSEFHTK